MGHLSLPWGIMSIFGLIIAFIPCLGWLNWFNIPFALIGLIFCAFGLARADSRGAAMGGALLCLTAVVIGILRLVLGAGLI